MPAAHDPVLGSFYLASILSGKLSGMYYDILSSILSRIYSVFSGIYSRHSFWHSIWHLFGIYSGKIFGILYDICMRGNLKLAGKRGQAESPDLWNACDIHAETTQYSAKKHSKGITTPWHKMLRHINPNNILSSLRLGFGCKNLSTGLLCK